MDKEILVQNIKKFCERKGVKPTVACKESGVGGSFISDINRGQTPSVAKVQMLADYLCVTTSDLLGETPPVHEGIPHEGYREILQEGGIRLLLDADAKVPQEHIDDIVEFIKFKQRNRDQ